MYCRLPVDSGWRLAADPGRITGNTQVIDLREESPTIWTQLREAAGGRSERGARPLDEDTQYGIRQFSARSSNQKHKS